MIKALDPVVARAAGRHRGRDHPRRRAGGADPGRGVALRGPAGPRGRVGRRRGGLTRVRELLGPAREAVPQDARPALPVPERDLRGGPGAARSSRSRRWSWRSSPGEVGSGKTLLTRALVDRVGERYEVGMILNPRLSPRQFLRTTAGGAGVRRAALPLERPPRPDPRPAARARRGRARRAADRRRGAPDPRQAHLRGDPPAHELPARRPQPDRDRAGGPARAARAPAPPRLPRPHPADRGVLRARAPRGRGHPRLPRAPAAGGRRRRERSSPSDAIARLHAAAGASPACSTSSRRRRSLEGMARGARQVDERTTWRRWWRRRTLARPRRGARVARMGRMADARKRARRGRGRCRAPEPARGRGRPGGRGAGRGPGVRATEPPGKAGARAAVTLPASGLAEDILRQLEHAAGGLGTTPVDAARPRVSPRTCCRGGGPGGHSLSFFAAPVQERRAAAEATEHLATFFLDREEYGVDVRQVQEIRRVSEITERAARARVHPRGHQPARPHPPGARPQAEARAWARSWRARATRIVVVRVRERLLGLLVDGASQVLKVPVSRIEPPPEEVVERGGDYIRGVAKLDDRLIILVDLERLLAHELRRRAPPPRAPGRSRRRTGSRRGVHDGSSTPSRSARSCSLLLAAIALGGRGRFRGLRPRRRRGADPRPDRQARALRGEQPRLQRQVRRADRGQAAAHAVSRGRGRRRAARARAPTWWGP